MNFKTLDLNLLRVLDALLDTGSTTRAAVALGLSQPAVSAALSRLRHALGDPLFLRHGRALAPTDYARSLRDPLRDLLDAAETMLNGPAPFDPATCTDRFFVSGSDYFSELLMPELAQRVAATAPGVRIQMVDLVPDSHIARLAEQNIDLVMMPDPGTQPGWIDKAPLLSSGFVVIARQGHPALAEAGVAEGGTLPLDLFCTLPQIAFSPEGRTRLMGDAALETLGRTRRVVATVPVFAGVSSAVARSDMIALLPTALARAVRDRLGLQLFIPPMPIPTVRLVMAWHRRATTTPAHKWLRREVAEIMAAHDEPLA